MKKALIFASVASMIDQFNMNNISILEELGYKVEVACNFEFGSSTSKDRVSEFRKELESRGIKTHQISVPRKIVAIREIIQAYKKAKSLVTINNYDIVHCHSPIGGVIARMACKKNREKGTKVIYTAHGFHFFKGAGIKNWIVFYSIEKWFSKYTDVLITINREDYSRAKKFFKAIRIEYVPGIGINTRKLDEVGIDKLSKRKELGIPMNSFLVLSVGELNKNKNHETIINSISKLSNKNVYYLICGQGILENKLKKLISELELDERVKLLGYRNDIEEISKVSDIFVFPSFREGLSVALMEAMAIGLPIICSNIRGNIDLIEEGKNGYLINPADVNGYVKSLDNLINDITLRQFMTKYNKETIINFDVDLVNKCMKKIYAEV